MGKIANLLADRIYITDDNPRRENPVNIRRDILKHCKRALDIADRKIAMRVAMRTIQPKDILLVVGKGHENYQIIGQNYFYLSDRIELKKYLQ